MWIKAIAHKKLLREARCLVTTDEAEVLVVAAGEDVYACENACPHQGLPLADGLIDVAGGTLTCVYHHWCFRLSDGSGCDNSARLRTWATRIDDGYVWIEPPSRP